MCLTTIKSGSSSSSSNIVFVTRQDWRFDPLAMGDEQTKSFHPMDCEDLDTHDYKIAVSLCDIPTASLRKRKENHLSCQRLDVSQGITFQPHLVPSSDRQNGAIYPGLLSDS